MANVALALCENRKSDHHARNHRPRSLAPDSRPGFRSSSGDDFTERRPPASQYKSAYVRSQPLPLSPQCLRSTTYSARERSIWRGTLSGRASSASWLFLAWARASAREASMALEELMASIAARRCASSRCPDSTALTGASSSTFSRQQRIGRVIRPWRRSLGASLSHEHGAKPRSARPL